MAHLNIPSLKTRKTRTPIPSPSKDAFDLEKGRVPRKNCVDPLLSRPNKTTTWTSDTPNANAQGGKREIAGIDDNTISLLRSENVDYFDIEEFVRHVVAFGRDQDIAELLRRAINTLVLHDDRSTLAENVRWATRMTELYTAIADVISAESNTIRRERLVREPLTDEVYRLAKDRKLLTKLVNRKLPTAVCEKLVSTRFFRSVLRVKYDAPECKLSFYLTFLLFCFAFCGFSILTYLQFNTETSFRNMRHLQDLKYALMVYVPAFGLAGIIAEFFRIWRIRKMELHYARQTNENYSFSNILTRLWIPRAWRSDLWRWVDFAASIVLFVVPLWTAIIEFKTDSTHSYREYHRSDNDDTKHNRKYSDVDAQYATFVAFGTFILWVKVLAFLKGVGLMFATFIQMLIKIVHDLQHFVVVMGVIFLAFTQIFYQRLGNVEKSRFDFAIDEPSPFRTFTYTLFSMYLLAFTGEFTVDAYPRVLDKFFLFLFIFVIVVVMLNVLIAIVSDSYNAAVASSQQLFWRSRLELLFEYENGHSLFRILCGNSFVLVPPPREAATTILTTELLDDQDEGPHSDAKVGRVLQIVTRVDKNVNHEFTRLKRQVFGDLKEIQDTFSNIQRSLAAAGSATPPAVPSIPPSVCPEVLMPGLASGRKLPRMPKNNPILELRVVRAGTQGEVSPRDHDELETTSSILPPSEPSTGCRRHTYS